MYIYIYVYVYIYICICVTENYDVIMYYDYYPIDLCLSPLFYIT